MYNFPTDAQRAANAANAQKSTGPRTEAGKRRGRLNAYRHGLTGQVCIFNNDERAAFDKHCTGIREALEPVGALELDLAQSIAEDRWRGTQPLGPRSRSRMRHLRSRPTRRVGGRQSPQD